MSRQIVFIGDSHASFFSGSDIIQPAFPNDCQNTYKQFTGVRLGPVLAYNLNRLGSQYQGREKLIQVIEQLNPQEHIIGLCFGEIDCRCHIVKQAHKQGVSIEKVVQKCFVSYQEVIDEIAARGFTIILWNVVPTSPATLNNPEFPHYGTDEERIKATELFNLELLNKADDRCIYYLNIYNKLYKSKRKDIHFFDGVHLSQSAMYFVCKELNKIEPFFSGSELIDIWFRSFKAKIKTGYFRCKVNLKKRLVSIVSFPAFGVNL